MAELDRRTAIKGAVLAGGLLAMGGGPAAAEPHSPRVLAKQLAVPWGIVFLPGGDALVGERDTCAIHRVRRSGGRTLVGVVPGITRLMAMALSPTFRTDRLVYAHVLTSSEARIIRMTYSTAGRLGTPERVYGGIPLGPDHAGGGLTFGPDQRMFISVGDLDMLDKPRDPTSVVGKVLRVNRDGSVPGDNPFGAGNPVWTVGHRNVECLTFAPSGKLWAPEFGEATTDELNVIVRGGDYGWPDYEGGGPAPIRAPFATWSPTSTCSPAGVAIKDGYAYVSALAGQALWRVKLNAPNAGQKTRYFHQTWGRIRSVGLAPDGALWLLTANRAGTYPRVPDDDRVIRVLT